MNAIPRFFKTSLLITLLPTLVSAAPDKGDFVRDIQPILEFNCISCHGPTKDKGDYRMHTRALAIKGGENDVGIVPGKPEKSPAYTSTTLPADDDLVMPPVKKETDPLLPKAEQELLKQWIAEGAKWPDGLELKPRKKVPMVIDFVEHVQPILETWCVSCHQESKDKGDLRIDTKELAMKGGENGVSIVPGKPLESSFYTLTILPEDHDDVMPPKNGPMTPEEIFILRRWIQQGAQWPDDVTLTPKAKEKKIGGTSPQKLFAAIDFELTPKEFKAYDYTVPGTEISFSMVPIKGGTFKMGSPDTEAGRKKDEGPQREATVSDFWMASTEATWDLYELWQMDLDRFNREQNKIEPGKRDPLADSTTKPTEPYRDMTFGMGKSGYPAISMTQLAAKNFCMWLSAKSGHFYRLPTEAEWEYACRAGSTTAYAFGDDPATLGDYAWYIENSDFQYQKVGTKKPNAWGLFDMHGNVSEWVLDQYMEDGYSKKETLPLAIPTTLYPRVVRGGAWDMEPPGLRSAFRDPSSKEWKRQDPQIPKSVWYHTDALHVGFRIVRPLKTPSKETLNTYWPTEEEMQAVPKR